MTAVAKLTADELAQEIRRVDGNHSLGAGALAEALMPFLAALSPAELGGVACYRVNGSHGPWGWVDGAPSAETLAELKFPIEYAYTTPRAADAVTDEVRELIDSSLDVLHCEDVHIPTGYLQRFRSAVQALTPPSAKGE